LKTYQFQGPLQGQLQVAIYLDSGATTPVDPRVLEEMLPYFTEHFGNAESSQHAYGWKAKSAVERARKQVGDLLKAHANEIIFTSGATESIHLGLFGYLDTLKEKCHLITSQAEHKATLDAFVKAKKIGHDVTFLPVNRYAQIELETLINALQPNTAFVSLMHANNEVGSLNPIGEIGAYLRERGGIVFHVDAAQTAGKHAINVETMKIDLLSLSAHKFYGPKGIGALYVRRPAIHLEAIMAGGGQERGLRGGTHNVPGIVGLGKACEIALDEMTVDAIRLSALRDKLITQLTRPENRIELNGHPSIRLCSNVHFSVHGVGADQLISGLHDFAFSTASACSGGAASHVLTAMGRSNHDPLTASARFGLSKFTTEAQVDRLIARMNEVIRNARTVSTGYDTRSGS